MCITTSKALSENLKRYLNAAGNDEKVYVTTETGNVVIVSEEYLRSLEETVYLYSIPGMRESIKEGVDTPLSECSEVDWENDLK